LPAMDGDAIIEFALNILSYVLWSFFPSRCIASPAKLCNIWAVASWKSKAGPFSII
jgi:hypothetical protein